MNDALLVALIGAGFLLAQAALLILAMAVNAKLRIIRRLEITEEDPTLPDVAVLNEKPYVYPVGKRNLYLRGLTHEMHRRFLGRYAEFLASVGGQLENLRLLQSIDDQKTRDEVIAQWRAVAFDDKMNAKLEALFRDVFLSDKRMNPERVKWRHIRRLGWEEILFIWQYAAARNVEAVEDFISALLAKLAGRSANAKHGSKLQSVCDAQLSPQNDSRCRPRSSLQNAAPNTQQENMTP